MAESRIRSRVTRRSTFTTFVLVTIATSVSLATSMTGHASPPANHERPGQAPDVVRARPLTLAAADFDADGVPDLLAGYAIADGGMLVLHRGNVDALYPNTPEARARRLAGQFTSSPFLPAPRAFPLPTAPDFLQTGDFDADGRFDAIAAAAGGRAIVLRGDGAGALGPAEPIALPGAVTTLAVGDINGPDGLADVVVGVAGDSGSRLLVFAGYDGAWHATPSVIDLPEPATALTLGKIDQEHTSDIAVATSRALLIVHGRDGRPPTSRAVLTRASDRAQVLLDRSGDASEAAVPGAAAVLRMRLDADARDDLVILRTGEATPTVQTTLVAAASHVVINTNDSGEGSLRQAILDANVSAGDDVITFDIPGPGPHTIVPATPLPPIQQLVTGEGGSVVVDGTSEPDYAGTPIVELSGALVGASGNGLTIGADACVVRGLAINRFAAGIFFTSEFGTAIGGLVEGNYIGTDVTGTLDLGNEVGVRLGLGIAQFAFGVAVGGTAAAARNVVSGNGIGMSVSSSRHIIQGNFIGTDATGLLPLGNSGPAVSLFSAGFIEVGGLQAGARNIVSGNEGPGFTFFESGAVSISGNHIGVDVSGEGPLGNGSHGIDALDSGITVSGNVISANAGHGIFAPTILATLDILNNRIGTNSAGTAALGNGQSGIEVNGEHRVISGNVVSGNGAHGIMLRGLENLVQDNLIGTDITGTVALGNRGDGIQVLDLAHTIGGDGDGNVVAFNGGRGIAIDLPFPTFISILSNAIFENGGLGIDLGADGPTPNDPCDADENANAPVLTGVTSSPSETTIAGQLNSRPNRPHLLQFFASAEPDPSGFGEGATFLGSTTVTTDASCNATFSATLPVAVPSGHVLTATSTITNEFGQLATSEFSNALRFVPQTSGEAIRALIAQVKNLVRQGELNKLAGFILTIKLQVASFFVERDLPRVAAVHIGGFIQIVELLVKVGQLDPADGQALVDAAQAILAGLETS